jgi:histidinol-phosphate/aromatic aminotransferase/cobyric acid decarboxylase-like protein
VRVSIGTRPDNERFLLALDQVLANPSDPGKGQSGTP